jgi:sRNA-binding carbon storage regulator CsrA
MELIILEIEESLVILKSNQKITLTAYKSKIDHAIDLGIDAPGSVTIDREEIRALKTHQESKKTSR